MNSTALPSRYFGTHRQWRIQSWSQGGVSESRKFKWLVKVGASKGVPPDLKKKPCRPMYYCDTMRQTHVQKEWYLFNLPHNNKTNTHVKVTLLCNTHS